MGKFGLNFFKPTEKFNGNWSVLESKSREWEKMYRERWSHDKEVRTTHGVNCTGSCSWKVFVKNGVITWENQQTDYPSCGPDMPEYEPRGCPRGASFSWYEYSPLRVKYPYIRGKLLELWQEALEENQGNKIAAWASIVEDEEKAKQYKSARGMGGHVRSNWKDVTDIIAAQLLYTIKKDGPDRIAGFTPIPAMSMVSYAAGARFINLLGGEMLSFYDWYADLPPASPQIWGEQTDVPESSDWYNASYIIMWGSNVPLTRTPDAHFMTEVRYKGTKVISVAPDYAENVKFADNWLAPNPGTDAAVAQAMTHVILQEYYINKPNQRFIDYAKQYTDMPFVLMLDKDENGFKAGRFLRATDLGQQTENGEWKPLIFDEISNELTVPNGTMGQRWEEGKQWNLKLEDDEGNKIDPSLSMADSEYELQQIQFPYFDSNGDGIFERPIPTKKVTLADGTETYITTVFDLMASQYGVRRFNHDLEADSYEDKDSKYTPAWQQEITGIKSNLVTQVAKEFAQNAIDTEGRSMIIMGAGVNHWFNSDTIYRAILNLVMLCGCQGVNGGGWAHYVGQEKCRPIEGWNTLAFAKDWQGPPRLQNGTSWFYFATDQLDITPLLNKGTLAIYMGVKRLPKIINQIQQFSDINFPIAIIFRASLFDEKVIIGTLSDIQQKIKSHQLEGMPGVCIIGDIVNYVESKIDSKPDQPFYIVQGEKGRAMEKCEILSDEGYGCIIEVKNKDKYHISQQQLYEKIKNQYYHQFIKV